MKIWICIPVHNRLGFTIDCLHSLFEQDYRDFSVLVCDDGSRDNTSDYLKTHFSEVSVMAGDGNLWWTGATNRCLEHALTNSRNNSDYILTLNNDLEVPANYLQSLVNCADKHPGSIIGSVVYDIQSRKPVEFGWKHSWVTTKARPIDPARDYSKLDPSVASVTHASGRGTLFPIKVFKELGLFDEKRLPHYFADYDFTHRARRAGYQILVSFNSCVYSHVEATGLPGFHKGRSLYSYFRYLSDIKSPAHLRTRWRYAARNCPTVLFPSYIFLDSLFTTWSYIKNTNSKATILK